MYTRSVQSPPASLRGLPTGKPRQVVPPAAPSRSVSASAFPSILSYAVLTPGQVLPVSRERNCPHAARSGDGAHRSLDPTRHPPQRCRGTGLDA